MPPAVLELFRSMPWGVRGFVLYALALFVVVGLTLPVVVAQAVQAPITPAGVIWMLLLAYLIFTLTLVLQRKEAGWLLALGLASLTLPPIPLLALAGAGPAALAVAAVALVLYSGLLRPAARAWFAEP